MLAGPSRSVTAPGPQCRSVLALASPAISLWHPLLCVSSLPTRMLPHTAGHSNRLHALRTQHEGLTVAPAGPEMMVATPPSTTMFTPRRTVRSWRLCPCGSQTLDTLLFKAAVPFTYLFLEIFNGKETLPKREVGQPCPRGFFSRTVFAFLLPPPPGPKFDLHLDRTELILHTAHVHGTHCTHSSHRTMYGVHLAYGCEGNFIIMNMDIGDLHHAVCTFADEPHSIHAVGAGDMDTKQECRYPRDHG